MNHKFKFYQGRANVEKFRVNVSDPLRGQSTIDPSTLEKIELIIGDNVVSSATGEITWVDNTIQIQPKLTTLTSLPVQSYSELVVYHKGSLSAVPVTISKGFTHTEQSG
jgi:hypothetical protein